ncbi:MAG TPA: hypothetical protein VF762_16625 [Blastocatellia bacterium]|jgi:phage protein D
MTVEKNPHSIVILGGDRYDTWQDKQIVKHVEVELATDMSSEARLTCYDPRFKILDRYSTADGVPRLIVLIYMGFGQDLGQPVFKGLLDKVERSDTDTTFIFGDMGLKMRGGLNHEYHKGLNDLEIKAKLARRNDLAFEGPDKAVELEKHPSMIQDFKNDWEFAMERSRSSGFNMFVRQDTLFVKEPAKVGAPVLTLKYRKDFWMEHDYSLTYKLPENQQGRPKVVHRYGRGRGGKRLVGESGAHNRGHHPVEGRHDVAEHTKKYINRRAHAHKELQREPSFNCTVKSIPPLPGVRPDVRNTIEMQGLGELFSGLYLCDKVRHEHGGGTFVTEYNLYRDIAR